MFLVDGERPARQRASARAEYSIRRVNAPARRILYSARQRANAPARQILDSARQRANAPARRILDSARRALARWSFTINQEHRLQTSTTSLNAIYRSGVKLNYLH